MPDLRAVEEESTRIVRATRMRGKVAFVSLFGTCQNRVHAIVTFLALLELLNAGKVALDARQGEVNGFFVEEATASEVPTSDEPAA